MNASNKGLARRLLASQKNKLKKRKKYLDIQREIYYIKNMKATTPLDQIVTTIIICSFLVAMFNLFMALADYVGRNGL